MMVSVWVIFFHSFYFLFHKLFCCRLFPNKTTANESAEHCLHDTIQTLRDLIPDDLVRLKSKL